MEENVILTNIATILTKDVLIDKQKNATKTQTSVIGFDIKNPKFPMFQKCPHDDDDEKLFFLQRFQQTFQQNSYQDVKMEGASYDKDMYLKRTLNMNNTDNGDKSERPKPKKRKGNFSRIDLLNIYDNTMFEGHLHLNKMSFLQIFKHVRSFLEEKKHLAEMPSQSVFSLAMWKLTTDEHFEVISSKFSIPLANCQKIIRNFWSIISDKYEHYIKWPNSHQMQQETLEGFWKYPEMKIFPNLYGIIALKRLDVFLEHVDGEVPLILQIICNSKNEIIDCFVELAKDYSFDDSPIGQTLERIEQAIPKKCYLIGDENFPLREYLMRPIDDECFQHEQLYNQLLTKVYQRSHEVLDTMAKRFNILYALEAKDLKEVRQIVETICALHNLCIEVGDDYVTRKREVVKFNWGSTNGMKVTIKNKVRNEKGGRRRTDLIEEIIN